MDYIKWSQEYVVQAERLLGAIERRKRMLKKVTTDERHTINAEIAKLRDIYYECMLIAKHLSERAGVVENAA